jgi:hypothetical protein
MECIASRVKDASWRSVLVRLILYRCFLFLVNYARMKPEVALKALPTLEEV